MIHNVYKLLRKQNEHVSLGRKEGLEQYMKTKRPIIKCEDLRNMKKEINGNVWVRVTLNAGQNKNQWSRSWKWK